MAIAGYLRLQDRGGVIVNRVLRQAISAEAALDAPDTLYRASLAA